MSTGNKKQQAKQTIDLNREKRKQKKKEKRKKGNYNNFNLRGR